MFKRWESVWLIDHVFRHERVAGRLDGMETFQDVQASCPKQGRITELMFRQPFLHRQTGFNVLYHLKLLVLGENPQNPLLFHVVPSF